jgi:hypothetical protein
MLDRVLPADRHRHPTLGRRRGRSSGSRTTDESTFESDPEDEGLDEVDRQSAQSFPASDAPSTSGGGGREPEEADAATPGSH